MLVHITIFCWKINMLAFFLTVNIKHLGLEIELLHILDKHSTADYSFQPRDTALIRGALEDRKFITKKRKIF